MGVLLGAIADDFTGATDLCNTLVRRGMRTVQLIGVPAENAPPPDAEAVVVALKSRTIPAAEAVATSLGALAWLRRAGARQILFKYCSTFDSTDQGNIGPVAEALLDALGSDFTVFCPAFPENGRTIFKGYLFVGDVLLSESGMRDHPLTPMRDPSLVRVLQRQTMGRVGLVQHATVARGPAAIRAAFDALRAGGMRHAIVDAIADADLEAIGEAAADLPLITGGSGIALGLPENFRRQGLLGDGGGADALPAVEGAAAVLSGSCSEATQRQVAFIAERAPVFTIDPLAAAEGRGCRGAGARLGGTAARRASGAGLGHRGAGRSCRRAAVASAASAPERWSRRSWRGSRPASSNAACGGLSWPAARRPARSCRRSASRDCASAARSTRACRGPSVSASQSWHWRSSRAISAPKISFCAPLTC